MLPCGGCAYRKSIPEDCHSRCTFDWTLEKDKPIKLRIKAFNIISNFAPSHARQWFKFPMNFDPVWGPDKCSGFNTKLNKKNVKTEYDPLVEIMAMLR